MKKTMLIDSEHPEETRVAVLSDKKVEDFDFESQNKKPLRGNIYLARITRVEPSLQAAFVEYGGNRHGFLAFSEIHPDYYQIPVSDRETIRQAEELETELAAELEKQAAEREERKEEARQQAACKKDADSSTIAPDDDDDAAYMVIHEDENADDDAYYARNFTAEGVNGDHDAPTASSEQDTDAPSTDAPSTDSDKANDDLPSSSDDTALPQSLVFAEPSDAAQPKAIPLPAVFSADTVATQTVTNSDAHDAPQEVDATNENAVEQNNDSNDSACNTSSDAMQEDTTDQNDGDSDTISIEPEESPSALAEATSPSLEERYRAARRARVQLIRNYRIQEVIKRRQILLVQVVKEERGNKGAALTTYLSLAGRYGVLMPNTARGGGISRKITNTSDRKRLRKTMAELDIPKNLGLIIRTAGAKRTKAEIKRDYEYLTRLWSNIRELTMKSIAPCLIYEEANLIKRAMRDLYDKDVSQVLVAGEEGYREAKDFMKMLMPSHAKHIQPYKERVPLFLSQGVEKQLDEMYQPVVNLKSGGYLVIQQTEALISIDVNSGRATRERNIEATALKTNLEAAVEVARQCRLRDLAGLVVIDFIDMEENRNIRNVEKKLKDAMKIDRARIQIGRISLFGLLELSRQRRRSGIVDGTTALCPTCQGAGNVRSLEMSALRILRSVEAEVLSQKIGEIDVTASAEVALFILNHKRDWLVRIEQSYGVKICIKTNKSFVGDVYETEKRGVSTKVPEPVSQVIQADLSEDVTESIKADTEPAASDDNVRDENPDDDKKPRRRRRRRRRGSGTQTEATSTQGEEAPQRDDSTPTPTAGDEETSTDTSVTLQKDSAPRRRSRSRRKPNAETPADSSDLQSAESKPQAHNSSSEDTTLSAVSTPDAPPTEDRIVAPTAQRTRPAEPHTPMPTIEDQKEASNDAPQKSDPPQSLHQDVQPTEKASRKRSGWWQRALKG